MEQTKKTFLTNPGLITISIFLFFCFVAWLIPSPTENIEITDAYYKEISGYVESHPELAKSVKDRFGNSNPAYINYGELDEIRQLVASLNSEKEKLLKLVNH